MKKYILGLAFIVVLLSLLSCDMKEKAVMQCKIDLLSVQLTASREVVNEARGEALELIKFSLTVGGNHDAQARIDDLTRKLS